MFYHILKGYQIYPSILSQTTIKQQAFAKQMIPVGHNLAVETVPVQTDTNSQVLASVITTSYFV